MSDRPKRKLIEVALPLEAINVASAREKSIRHGHPSTLHLWWARRPLAACRAVLFASLVDDPSSDPDRFPTPKAVEDERTRLFGIIERLVQWENTTNEAVLEEARAEIRRSTGGNPPPVLDPFCGGGSIPLEAQRLGLTAYAIDLNPVAVLITKALIEIPPKFANMPPVHPDARRGVGGTALGRARPGSPRTSAATAHGCATRPSAGSATSTRRSACRRSRRRRSDGHRLALGSDSHVPEPGLRRPMPLVRSFELSTKKGKRGLGRADRRPRREDGRASRSEPGTEGHLIRERSAAEALRCLVCESPVPLDTSVLRAERAHGCSAHGDRRRGPRCGSTCAPTDDQAAIARSAVSRTGRPTKSLSTQPQDIAAPSATGCTRIRDLFTSRQLVALTTFATSSARPASGRS